MSQITITINSQDDASKKLTDLKNLDRKPAPIDPRVAQMLELLKKRLNRQIDPVGGSI